nr:pentatricopeptide repeat-containing protein At5g44230 [Coffea arabica]
MVSLSKKLIKTLRRPAILIPQFYEPKAPALDLQEPFIPVSKLQETKLLEAQLVSILDSCISLTEIKRVHAHIIRKGLDQCSFLLTKLVRVLCKLNTPIDTYARLIFSQVYCPNPFLYTAIIRGYSVQGPLEKAVFLYGQMRRDDILPVSFTFTALLKACTGVLNVDLGRQIHGQSLKIGGFVQDLFVGNTLIDMYVKCGCLDFARRVFDELPTRDVISFTALIVAYAKSGDMVAASELFDRLPVKDMVAWTAMVTGFAQNAQPKEALEYFEKMQNSGVNTDEVTLSSVISACAQLGAIKYANWVRDFAEKSGFGLTDNVLVGSALIDMYSKCGSVEDAFKVFESMKDRNVFSYSSMIGGFAMHGCAREAIELFEKMMKVEVKPNKVTFVGVLAACSHAGLVEQGQHFFGMMKNGCGIKPSVDHYTCMIDLLGRAGRLEEALELIQTMPIEPNGSIWGALLGACRIHRNPKVAEIAAKQLFQLEPDGIGNYVLLSHIYASAGRWEDVSRVRKLIRAKRLIKTPSLSMVEDENGGLHNFYSDDTIHPESKLIKQTLQDLLKRLKVHGYQPILSSAPYDVSDEEKERILLTHSEKLALAYSLLTTSANCVIRITKNLRICEDCHSVMSRASQLTSREIVVRDNLRFHHFRKGICSCGDFW